MLRVIDLYNYMTANQPYQYYINEFPSTSIDDCAVVKINTGMAPSEWTQKKRPAVQIIIRSASPQTADTKAYEIYEYMHNRTEFSIGGTRIVRCTAMQSAPLYLGQDENNRYLYSVNFTAVTM